MGRTWTTNARRIEWGFDYARVADWLGHDSVEMVRKHYEKDARIHMKLYGDAWLDRAFRKPKSKRTVESPKMASLSASSPVEYDAPAGEYTLFVARLGYDAVPKKVQVVDGETTEVTISLAPIAIVEDFVDVLEFRLYMSCGGGLVGVTFTGGCPAALGNHRVVADHNVTNQVLTAMSELVWTQNSAFSSKELRLDMGKDESGGSLPSFKHRYGSVTGKSPVVVRADAEFDGLSDLEDGEYKIRHRVWVPFRSADPPVVILVIQQPMVVWSSMAYGAPLPDVYSALPDV